jgi:glycosyltransferase involved in cell wall biosynthesis
MRAKKVTLYSLTGFSKNNLQLLRLLIQQELTLLVATDVGSVSEVVIDNKTGILCDSSEKQLIEGIKKLDLDKKLRSTFSKNAKSMALKNFSTSKFIKAHRDVYLKA